MARPSSDLIFMGQALLSAQRATCVRKKVGCVLTKRSHSKEYIISTGYNGPSSGETHCIDIPCSGARFDSGQGLEQCRAVHAEQNAILNCNWPEIYGCYVTCFPCVWCTKLLLNANITKLVYMEDYANSDESMSFFENKGVLVLKIDRKELEWLIGTIM